MAALKRRVVPLVPAAPVETTFSDAAKPPLGDVGDRLARFMRPGPLTLAALPPLSLYVHIPWCMRKCPYCDFNSHEARAEPPEERYVAALIADLDRALPEV